MCAFISLFYSMVTWLFLRADLTASPLLAGGGLAVFALGQAGNLYHHVLLANLRKHQKGCARRRDLSRTRSRRCTSRARAAARPTRR